MFKKKKILPLVLVAALFVCGPLFAHALDASEESAPTDITKIEPQAGIADGAMMKGGKGERDFKYHQAKERFASETEPRPAVTENDMHVHGDMVVMDEYVLGAEDRVKITVFGESELSADYRVGSDGTIAFPLIGDVMVEGLTLKQAQEVIKNKLKQGFLKKPSVSIEIAESRPFYILGEVRRPGSYNYIAGMNVLQAVAISGGFTYRANRKTMEILRGAKAPKQPIKAAPAESVKPGDIIFIRERFF